MNRWTPARSASLAGSPAGPGPSHTLPGFADFPSRAPARLAVPAMPLGPRVGGLKVLRFIDLFLPRQGPLGIRGY
jgi:hypothetical protein